MSLYRKNEQGNIVRTAGNVIQRWNDRIFKTTHRVVDNKDYYTIETGAAKFINSLTNFTEFQLYIDVPNETESVFIEFNGESKALYRTDGLTIAVGSISDKLAVYTTDDGNMYLEIVSTAAAIDIELREAVGVIESEAGGYIESETEGLLLTETEDTFARQEIGKVRQELSVVESEVYATKVVNDLTSTSTTRALSANMGKSLQDTKQDKSPLDGKSYLLKDGGLVPLISEPTKNKFNPETIIIGKNALLDNAGSRAVSEVIQVPVSGLAISCKTLPSNLKYEINGYPDEAANSPTYSSGWKTSAGIFETVKFGPYIRVLFGSVNNEALTSADFEGLELQIEEGLTPTEYVPYGRIAIDTVARNKTFSNAVKLKVCSYNIGLYSFGVPDNTLEPNVVDNLKHFLCKNNFDIIGLQENRTIVNNVNINNDIYSYIYNSQIDTTNWTCIKSQYNLTNVGTGSFTAGSRTYCYGTITVGNKDVFIMSVHFALNWNDRQSNYTELLEILAQHQRFIVFGDFNAGNEYGTTVQAQLEYDTLIGAGYKVANGGFLGLFTTTGSGYQDNICVSSNIKIVNSGHLDVFDEMNSDHIPCFAELII